MPLRFDVHRPAPALLLVALVCLSITGIDPAFAQVNEADSLALVAFINTTDVEVSQVPFPGRTAWGEGPVRLWAGVTVTDGRVTGLSIPNLDGTLPDELGNEDALKALAFLLSSNSEVGQGLTGTIPEWIGNLENLTGLSLFQNRLSGLIPAALGQLSNLASLGLGENDLEGFAPGSYDGWISLQTVGINGNNMQDLPDLSGLPALQTLWVYHNPLTFDDLEPLVDLVGVINFRYWPMDLVETQVDPSTHTLSVEMGGTRTTHKWYKGPFGLFNPPIANATGRVYRPLESGEYYAVGQDERFPELKLRSEEAFVEAGPLTLVVNDAGDFLDLVPGDGVCETDPTAPGEQCTLRAALETINALGSDGFTVSFNIPGTGVPKLKQFTELPAIERSVVIDGTTQAAGRVEISGESAGEGVSGLILTGGFSTVRGLVINRFPKHGLILRTRGGNTVEGTFIGTDVAGTGALGNGGIGLWLDVSANNQIGGPTPEAQNRISANGDAGILVSGISNKIQGNIIGSPTNDVTGALGNTEDGIRIEGASNTMIGGTGTGEGNLIRANKGNGVVVYGGGALPEARATTIRRNRIYGNTGLGIDLGGDGVTANDLGDPLTVDDDTGPNDLLNFPTGITAVPDPANATKLIISGFVETPFANLVSVELYASSKPHASGFGEGQVFIAEVAVRSEGNFLVTVDQSDVPFPFLSGTTIGFDGATTSEFSAICGDPDGDGNPDSDSDGLCDDWEMKGLDYDGDGTVDLPLHEQPFGANARRKDLFVEIDWMKAADHDHEPVAEGLTDVRNAFARAPVQNPDGTSGIDLHLMTDEAVQHFTNIRFNADPVMVAEDGTFNDIKIGVSACGTGDGVGHFGTAADRAATNCDAVLGARRLAFRYLIFGHSHAHSPGSSGRSELPGNDFMVTIGKWNDEDLRKNGGSSDLTEARRHVEAGTLMHEFGHALGLRHGGADNIHCKPNFPSVMNYLLQLRGIIPNRPLDYSRTAQASLNEAALSEAAGLDGPMGRSIFYNPSPNVGVRVLPPVKVPTNMRPIDWNGDGVINPGMVAADINYHRVKRCGVFDADTNGDGDRDGPGLIVLTGHNDWANIQYNFRTSLDFADGADRETVPDGEEHEEVTEEEATEAAASVDFDEDGIVNALDNCSSIANPGQEDANADGVGDVCENVGLLTIAVSPQGVVLMPGETVQFTGYGFDMLGLETEANPAWSAEGGTIDASGLYTAGGEVGVYTVTATSSDGQVAGTTKVEIAKVVSVEEEAMPTSFSLAQNYPNPFNPVTTIEYGLPSSAHVTLRVYDVLGREVAMLVNAVQAAGKHQARFDAGDLPSGVYLYRMAAGTFSRTRVMLLVR